MHVIWRNLFYARVRRSNGCVESHSIPYTICALALCFRSGAGFDCFACAGIEGLIHPVPGAAKRKMLMAEVAAGHGEDGEDSGSHIGGHLSGPEPMTQQERERRQHDEREDHAGAVNGEAAQPFAQVVAASAKDEPLVAEKRHGDGDDVGEQTGYLRTVDTEPAEEIVERDKEPVAETGIEAANHQIADDLPCLGPLRTRTHDDDRSGKLMRSFSITSGRFCTKVWMEPTYSPMMPRHSSCTEPRKKRPSTSGATPSEKLFQKTIL